LGLTIVFDYSGTLSLEAVAFAKDDVLERELRLSGLADFGVASPAVFWNRIVNPAWEEGSRTPTGYRRLMVKKISEEWTVNRKEASLAVLDKAAGIFVTQYFAHSRIDPSWIPLLRELYDHPLITTVVATDHYAEATKAIKGQFQEMQLQALPLPTAGGDRIGAGAKVDELAKSRHPGENRCPELSKHSESQDTCFRRHDNYDSSSTFCETVKVGDRVRGGGESRNCFFIANSADLGYHKDQEEFWVLVREQTNWTHGDRLLLVDDFGANEVAGDNYGQEARVEARRQRTTALLTKVFDGTAEVMPFVLSGEGTSRNGEVRLLIEPIALKIREILQADG